MTTSEAAGGRQVYYYIKFCPVDPEGCRCGPWNKDRWRNTKEEAVAKFRDHLYDKHRIVSDQLMQTFCDALEFETYNDPAGVEEPRGPATPPPVMTPKSENDDTIRISPDVGLALNLAAEQIQEAIRNAKAWNKCTRSYVSTMDDAIASLESSRDTMNILLNTKLE